MSAAQAPSLLRSIQDQVRMDLKPSVHPIPYTLRPRPSLHPIYPTPYALDPRTYSLHPTPYTLHPTPYALDLKPAVLNPRPSPQTVKACVGDEGGGEGGRGSNHTPRA